MPPSLYSTLEFVSKQVTVVANFSNDENHCKLHKLRDADICLTEVCFTALLVHPYPREL
jgi:hypothetical protein